MTKDQYIAKMETFIQKIVADWRLFPPTYLEEGKNILALAEGNQAVRVSRKTKIMDLLSTSPMSVTEMAERLGMAKPNLSKVLGELLADQKVTFYEEPGNRSRKIFSIVEGEK